MEQAKLKLIRSGIQTLGMVHPELAGHVALRLFTTPRKIERPGWEIELIQKGQPLRLRSGLSAYAWRAEQGEDHGKKILLVHGWQGRGTQLGRLVYPLREAGFHVIALDGPAHGDSPGKSTNVKMFADHLRDVAFEVGGLHGVIAHSFGAGATAIALTEGLQSNKVILVASPSNLQWVIDDFCQTMGMSGRLATTFKKRLERWSGISVSDLNIASMGSRITTPALIVHDPEDKEVPFQSAKTIVESWPSATLLPLTNVGHRRVLKAPEFLQAAVDFLRVP